MQRPGCPAALLPPLGGALTAQLHTPLSPPIPTSRYLNPVNTVKMRFIQHFSIQMSTITPQWETFFPSPRWLCTKVWGFSITAPTPWNLSPWTLNLLPPFPPLRKQSELNFKSCFYLMFSSAAITFICENIFYVFFVFLLLYFIPFSDACL